MRCNKCPYEGKYEVDYGDYERPDIGCAIATWEELLDNEQGIGCILRLKTIEKRAKQIEEDINE